MNLVVNARDAMPGGGRLTIETSELELTIAGAIEIGVPAGRYAVLSVTDTGVGMDAATQRRIFEPFFTTKEVGRGTGLGLATVFGIVQQAAGAIAVRSELGRGSTFSVYLPRAAGQAANDAVIAATSPVRGSGSVLIVEDDSHLRSLLHQRLHSLGYRTTVAHDAVSAFEALLQPGASIDLLLTDLVLPGIDGRALAKRITAQRPQVKVVFMSGYSEQVAIPASVTSGRREHFIQKPFTLDELSRVLRHALESRPSHDDRTSVRV
jgi:CheY-like chemotaxis protein